MGLAADWTIYTRRTGIACLPVRSAHYLFSVFKDVLPMTDDFVSNKLNKRVEELEKQMALYKAIDTELTQGINLYRFIVENSHVGIFIIDDNYHVVYGNNELINIIGYELDEIIGSDFRHYIAMENRNEVADRYSRRQKGEILPYRYEVTARSKDGTTKMVEISVAVTKSFADRILTVVQVFDITDRKKMEAELKNSEKKYRDLFQNVFDFIFIHDLEGNFIETNAHYVTEMGGAPEEIAHANLRDLIPEEYGARFDDYLNRILENKTDEGLVSIKIPSGEIRVLEYKNSLIYDDHDLPKGVWGSARDITEHIKAKNALAASEEKYRTMIQNIEDFYFEINLNGDLLFFNDALVKHSGYSREDIMGMNFREYTAPDDIDKMYKMFNKVYRTGEIGKEMNHKLIRKDGSLIYIETTCTLMRDENGKPIGFRGVSRDVTERKLSEKVLRESEQRFREIIKGTPIPTFVINDYHIVTHWNEACEKLTGLKANLVIGTNDHWKPFYSKERPCLADLVLDKAPKSAINRLFNNKARISKSVKGAYEVEAFFPQLASGGRWISLTAAPIKDSRGNITGAIQTLQDITENKQAELNLLKMHDALEEKVKERTQGLEETNIAMKVLLKKREDDKRDLEKQMLANIREIIQPYIARLKATPMKERQRVLLEIIESNLEDIASPFMRGLSDSLHKLTPSEIQVINLIKQDKTTKEMSEFLNVSARTVEFHRDNIRKKLGIKNKKINLRSYLLSIR